MHATAASGRRPSCSRICALVSLADHRLEVAHQFRVGVGAGDGADDVKGVAHMGHPVAQGIVHGVLQGRRAAGDAMDPGAQELHAEDVEGLAADILGPHEDLALQTEQRGDGGGRHPVLAGAGLGDHLLLPHAPGQQHLADGVVDLVGAGVVEVLALEVDLRPAALFGQSPGKVEGAGPADVVLQPVGELLVEGRIRLGLTIGSVQLQKRGHQGLGHVAAAELAEMAAFVRVVVHGNSGWIGNG